jgi:all-beta uncharacterized protein
MRRLLQAALVACALLLSVRSSLASPGSFVYVAMPACAFTMCDLRLYVFDAATSALATTVPIAWGSGASSPGIAISPDGSRVYVSVSVGTSDRGSVPSVIAVDTTRHQVIGPLGAAPPGKLAVSRDGRLLFITTLSGTLYVYDTTTQWEITRLPATTSGPFYVPPPVAADPVRDRVYWLQATTCGTNVRAYDTALGNEITLPGASSASFDWLDVFASRDGTRLYLSAPATPCGTNSGGDVRIIDLASTTTIADLRPGTKPFVIAPRGTVDAPSSHRMYVWELAGVTAVDRDTFAAVASFTVPAVTSIGVSADESRAYVAAGQLPTTTLTVLDTKSNTVVSVVPLFGVPSNVVTTPSAPAANVCSYGVSTHQSSWSVNGGSGSIALTTNCSWVASSSASWARLSAQSGTGNATLALTVDPNFTTTNRSTTVTIGGQLVTVTQASFSATAPFGMVDTPADGTSGVSGALAVTGWALDDVGVTGVRIYRDPVQGESPTQQIFIGNATFVDGARPDVQALYPSLPYASRAGWGLQVLTNMLPHQGTGTYRLYAYADDVEGHTTLLGFRAFSANNQTATLPFGTIDTPGQGETVSGTVVNFGWALSSNPIATDGSTIDVLVDGVVVGHPVYNNFRSDIASLFPTFPNSTGAIGYFVLDTTTFANGIHTIAWVVRDSTGATQGIGSRYFIVSN